MAEEEGGKKAVTESRLEEALSSRLSYFYEHATSLNMLGIRRMLEEDLGLEKFALDVHKRFIKQFVGKNLVGNPGKNSDSTAEVKEVTKDSEKDEQLKAPNSKAETSRREESPVGTKGGTVNLQNTNLAESAIKKAILERADYFRSSAETLQLPSTRRLLEGDLGLQIHALDPFKKFIRQELEKSCDLEDPFSSLSDDLLSVIISSLTMNEVAKMSILSRRWLDVWIHTPVLIFLMSDSFDRLEFIEWVNHALERHKGPCLREFKIVCDLESKFDKDIDNWLEFALSRKVEKLELNILLPGIKVGDKGHNYCFPGRFLQTDLLMCLKSLSLKDLYLNNKYISYFLYDCPFLERLELIGIPIIMKLAISSPNSTLKHLSIRDWPNLFVLSITCANFVSLEVPSLGAGLTLTDLPLLVEFSVSGEKRMALKKSLTLSRAGSFHSQLEALTIRALQSKEIIDLHYLAQMTKLKRLVVEVRALVDNSLTTLIYIINSCPRLEEFKLMLYWADREWTHAEGGSLSPQSNTLKVFEFLGYFGHASDVELIVHVVENAACLEKIIIDPRYQVYLEEPCYVESDTEQEARSLAVAQLEDLRITQRIPPHIDVIIC